MSEHDDRMNQFRGFLESKGRPLTRERFVVAELAFANPGPIDVEKLCREAHPQGSRSTVYRTVTYLQEAGLIELPPQ